MSQAHIANGQHSDEGGTAGCKQLAEYADGTRSIAVAMTRARRRAD